MIIGELFENSAESVAKEQLKEMKRFINYVIGIILAFGVVTLCGCKPIECNFPEISDPYEYGDYVYELWNEGDEEYEHIRIIELSEQGKTKKELLIPEEINGVPVKYLGYNYGFSYVGEFNSRNTEKLFLTKIYGSHSRFFYMSGLVYITDADIYFNFGGVDSQRIRLSAREWKRYYEMKNYKHELDKTRFADVVYYKNDGSDKISFVDDYDGGKITFVPPAPEREGYEFLGWYKEEECKNKWDFAVDEVPVKEYSEDGEYNFKETSLFAKWSEI